MRYPGRILRYVGVLVPIALALPGFASAVDGVIQINQGIALAGGVTPGDTAGFPVSISEPGSYRLTGNLTLSTANTTGIQIVSDDVTLDLNGFTIAGPTVCSGAGSSLLCSPTGTTGHGITSFSNRIVVRNGTVRGAGSSGIRLLGTESLVEGILAFSNGGITGAAIWVGPNGVVRNCIARASNGDAGILVGLASRVVGSTTNDNRNRGIWCSGGLFEGNVVVGNGGHGIDCGASGGSTISHNSIASNGGDGIRAQGLATVEDNAVFLSSDDGIEVGAGSLVSRNTVRFSTDFGVVLGLNSVASRNILTLNTLAISLGAGGVSALDNFCDGAAC